MDESGECDDIVIAHQIDRLRSFNSRLIGDRPNRLLGTLLVIVEVYLATAACVAAGIGLWFARDEVWSFIDWLLWVPLLLVAGLSLATFSAIRWQRLSDSHFLDRRTQTAGAIVGTAVGCILVAWITLHTYVNPEDSAERTDVAQIAVAVVAGVVVAAGSLIAWQRLNLDRESRLTENFTAAVEQLGAVHSNSGEPNYEVRLGGIYALERIAKNWAQRGEAQDYWAVIGVLTAYLRHNATSKLDSASMAPDVEAIVEVLRRRDGKGIEWRNEFRIDLNGVHLPRANLHGIWLYEASLNGAFLEGANLSGAALTRASLWEAQLQHADLSGAQLERAILIGAKLSGAFMREANLRGAQLAEADLDETHLIGASLNGANLKDANLSGAVLWDPIWKDIFPRASFKLAWLKGADLSGVEELTIGVLLEAREVVTSQVPEELRAQYTQLLRKASKEPS